MLQPTPLNFHLTITRKTGVFINAPLTMSVGRGSAAGALIKVGSSVPSGINITRTNFSGAVTLTFTGLPANVTVVPAANPVLNNNAIFTFTAAVGAIPGSYPITITGSGTGITNASVVLTLQVNP